MIINGRKTSTVRMGFVFFTNERVKFKFRSHPDLFVLIKKIDYSKSLQDLTDEDAEIDGFENLQKLKNTLLEFYPDINEKTQLTIVHFEIRY
jgi:hypothetical protein